eukprot:IDg11739t1
MGENRKLKEKHERRKRYILEKEYANALKRGPVTDPDVASRQHKFSVRVIKDMLDDEACLSFSKPVTELWDIDELPGYFNKVKKPMDLGTILENLERDEFINEDTKLFDFTMFIKDVHLVFNNCLAYNSTGTDLAKLGKRLMGSFDRQIREIPLQRQLGDENKQPDPATPPVAADDTGKADAVGSDSEDDKKPYSGEYEGSARRVDRKVADLSDKSGSEDEGSAENDSPSRRMKADRTDDDEEEDSVEQLARKVSALKKLKARSEGNLAEIEMELNVPMSAKERMILRDEVEQAPWEKVDKVVNILQKYVNKAVSELGKGADPEYVTLELNDVEPHLLRDVEAVVKPDPRRE